MRVVARGKNREVSFTTAEEFDLLLAQLRALVRTEEVTVYVDTLMSTHVHLRMQAFTHDALGRPLRWVMPETARAFHTEFRGHHTDLRSRSEGGLQKPWRALPE
jgi:REP element-mobilizing transposase RayT